MIKVKDNARFNTFDNSGTANGYLVPIYNENDKFFEEGKEPKQVYMTVIFPGHIKGPHLHYVRTGCFTCIKGNARFIIKTESGYQQFYSGEDHCYRSVIVPTGHAAALQCIGDSEALVLNMPYPAWTPTMNDEHTMAFDDFDFTLQDH
jgi:dTDP-4-dehydrorhamnose 3,5-epimerase-like enzyme